MSKMNPGKAKDSPSEDEGGGGAPEWMVTFSDCMTLLLTFFVLLLSFSSFDDSTFQELRAIFRKSLPANNISSQDVRSAIVERENFTPQRPPAQGSEKPTLENESENTPKKIELLRLGEKKVFMIASDRIFWGREARLSSKGTALLDMVGEFLRQIDTRIIVSENGKGESQHLALERGWSIAEYLTEENGVNIDRLSVSAESTIERGDNGGVYKFRSEKDRVVEIVLLDRSMYD